MLSLEPKYTLFGTLAEMIAPSALSRLLAKRVTHVACRPIDGHVGVAGGKLYYVDTNIGRLVLKRMSMATDWIMFASEDHRCRSVTLWQYGLLDQLHPHLEHRTIACSHDGDGWAILMDDLTGHLFAENKPMTPELVPAFLDALARLHATFWNDPRLHDPRLGLCDPARLLDMSSLPVAENRDNGTRGLIPAWVRNGWTIMEEMLDADVYALLRQLIESPRCVFGALSRYPYTLLHGDFRAENVAYTGRPVAFDWQEASCSLMTIDLAWLIKVPFVRNTLGDERAIRYYRARLEGYLNQSFDDADWQAMVGLGYLVDALRAACFEAYFHKQRTINPSERDHLERAVVIRNRQTRDAIRWLYI